MDIRCFPFHRVLGDLTYPSKFNQQKTTTFLYIIFKYITRSSKNYHVNTLKKVLIICAIQGRNFPLKVNTKEKLISFKMFSLLQVSHIVNKNFFLSNVLFFRLIYF